MQQFDRVVQALRDWFHTFPILVALEPFALYIAGVSLAGSFLVYIASQYFSFLGMLAGPAHFSFLLAVWLLLVSPNLKWAPYALFANAVFILFPFTTFSLYDIIDAVVNVLFGYGLLRYSAFSTIGERGK